jgi:hypothetical protein
VSGDAVHHPTWPLLLKIEHMVKLQVFGNNSKTVSNIKNLPWGKNDNRSPGKEDLSNYWVFLQSTALLLHAH